MGAHLSNNIIKPIGDGLSSFSESLICKSDFHRTQERPIYERTRPQMCILLEAANNSAEYYCNDLKVIIWEYLKPSGLPTRLVPIKRYMDNEPDVPTLIGSFTFQDGSIGRFRATTGELLSRSYLRPDGSIAHELNDEFVLDLLIPPEDANVTPHTVFSAIQRHSGSSIVCDTFNCRILEIDNNHAIYYYDKVNCEDAPRMAFPSDIIFIKDRFILVADTSNNRVVQFDTKDRKKPGEVLLDGLQRPTCIAFDEHLSILYLVMLTTQVFVWRYGMAPSGNLFQLDKQLIGIESPIQQLDSIGAGKLIASMRFKGSNVAVVLEPEFD